MEWVAVTVFIALVGLIVMLIKPAMSLSKTLAELTGEVKTLNGRLDELNDRNRKAHDALFLGQREHESRLDELEREFILLKAKDA